MHLSGSRGIMVLQRVVLNTSVINCRCVIYMPNSELSTASDKHPKPEKCDIVGPPNNVSNLRPILFHVPKNESSLEKQFRLKREEVQKWNEMFWTKHNTKFFQQKEKFMSEHASKKSARDTPMSSDEVSIFYKKFLDENWKIHQAYNVEWYQKNVGLLLLGLRVFILRTLKKLRLIGKITA